MKYYSREDVVGKEVIEAEAKKLGVVKDLAFSTEGKAALILDRVDEKGELQEAILPFDKILKIGDVILIKSASDLESSLAPGKICPNCKSKNPLNAKYCFKCGVTLQKKEKK
ncbi:PRC-barrel domain-containing protein [Candidatus Bathyarchaeota archaeon]|nr:PRC-barrel domain-containing protein [Candidatus Bathyarchaeota archaeon]